MRCEEVHRELGPYLDSELSPDLSFEIGEHIQNCRACSERLHSEKKIEKHLQSVILKEDREDLRIWDNAVEKVTGVGQRFRKLRIGYIAAAAALILAVGFSAWHLALQHHELDLARFVAQGHEDYLENRQKPAVETQDPRELGRYFSERLGFPVGFTREFPRGYTLTGGRTCFLHGVPAAFWMARKGDALLSIFSFARHQLAIFPDAAKRSAAESGRLHCQVGDLEFFALVDGEQVISAIGNLRADELEGVILHLAGK